MTVHGDTDDQLYYTPAEVARRMGTDAKTVTRWGDQRKVGFIETFGGHRRYYKKDVDAWLEKHDFPALG